MAENMNRIIFDVGPGVLPDLPPHRRWIWEVPDGRLVESLEALAILNKTVHHVNTGLPIDLSDR